jgi:hypothetical protein
MPAVDGLDVSSETLAIHIPVGNMKCSDELPAGRIRMRQYHRTKVSVRAGRYSCGSQKRASVDDTEERSVIHGPVRSAGSSSEGSGSGDVNRVGALQPGGLSRIFPSRQRGRVNRWLNRIPFEERGRENRFPSVRAGSGRKSGGQPAGVKVALGSALTTNKPSARPGSSPA